MCMILLIGKVHWQNTWEELRKVENKEKKKKKLGLTTQIFIALALGAVVGIVLNYLVLPMM